MKLSSCGDLVAKLQSKSALPREESVDWVHGMPGTSGSWGRSPTLHPPASAAVARWHRDKPTCTAISQLQRRGSHFQDKIDQRIVCMKSLGLHTPPPSHPKGQLWQQLVRLKMMGIPKLGPCLLA